MQRHVVERTSHYLHYLQHRKTTTEISRYVEAWEIKEGQHPMIVPKHQDKGDETYLEVVLGSNNFTLL